MLILCTQFPCSSSSLALLKHQVTIQAVIDSLSLVLRVKVVSLSDFETNTLIISRTGFVSMYLLEVKLP